MSNLSKLFVVVSIGSFFYFGLGYSFPEATIDARIKNTYKYNDAFLSTTIGSLYLNESSNRIKEIREKIYREELQKYSSIALQRMILAGFLFVFSTLYFFWTRK